MLILPNMRFAATGSPIRKSAGAALLDTCKEVKGKDPVQIGSYRGFTMSVAFDSMWKIVHADAERPDDPSC